MKAEGDLPIVMHLSKDAAFRLAHELPFDHAVAVEIRECFKIEHVDEPSKPQMQPASRDDEPLDRLLNEAVLVVAEHDRASASLLQRRLRIGYARAARIVDQLEEMGLIGAFDGSTARVVDRPKCSLWLARKR
jgi:DNA segregation ATPase FtsK/SpoIIIE-like protein